MAEHQLNDPDVDAVRVQPAGPLVSEVVPPEVDALQLLPVPFLALLFGPWLDAVGEHLKCFPGRLNRRLVLAVHAPEDERVRSQSRPTFEDRRQPSLRIEW